MNIISKFHDYYDGVARQGVDTSIVYLRESFRYDFEKKSYPSVYDTLPEITYKFFTLNVPGRRSNENDKLTLTYMVLGYCGNMYPLVEIRAHSSIVCSVPEEYTYVYSIDDLEKVLKEKYDTQLASSRRGSFSFFRKSSNDLYQLFAQDLSRLKSFFTEYNCPTFLYFDLTPDRCPSIATNVALKSLQFFKVKDAYTCFQDISMYVSGVLKSPTSNMIQISDEDKLSKHGFDEWSFRKLPTKRK